MNNSKNDDIIKKKNKVEGEVMNKINSNKSSRLGTGLIICMTIMIIVSGYISIFSLRNYLFNLKITQYPTVTLIDKGEKICTDNKKNKKNKVDSNCKHLYEYVIERQTYYTKIKEGKKPVPEKVYYNPEDPTKYYIVYDSTMSFLISFIFFSILMVICLVMLIYVIKTKRKNRKQMKEER